MRSRSRPCVALKAYTDTGAIERSCPNCGAAEGYWCVTPDGRDRRMPCVRRAAQLPSVELSPGQVAPDRCATPGNAEPDSEHSRSPQQTSQVSARATAGGPKYRTGRGP